MTQAAFKVLWLMNEGVINCFREGSEVWVARGVLKLMGSGKIQTKRVAYMLAPPIFQQASVNEEISQMVLLSANAFRKDFQTIASPHQVLNASCALNCLSSLCNPELAELLYSEILPLYACTRPLLKKKACILSYKMILNHLDSAEKICPYLADRLRDPVLSVQIAAVTTIF
jgi:AP-3 complex subunit delta-1